MRFDCGETYEEWEARLSDWHPWFAWHPVRLGSHDCRWLETVMRKGTIYGCPGDYYWVWKYKAEEKK